MKNKSLTEIEMKSIMGGYSINPSVSSMERFEIAGGYGVRVATKHFSESLKSLFRRW